LRPYLPACPRACRSTSLDPSNPTYLRSLGLVMRNSGQHQQAAEVLGRVLDLLPDDEVSLQARG